MKLYYKTIGIGQPLVILHGLFGSLDNWQTLAKKIAEYYQVITIDLRNHGHSPWNDDFSIDVMVADLKELFDQLQLKNILLLGHSMGGKVAMTFAQQYPERLQKLIVVDIGIKKYPPHHQHILEAIKTLNLETIISRTQAEQHFQKHIQSFAVRQFLLKNLYWKEEKLTWRMNVSVIEQKIPEILKEIDNGECSVQTLFVRGELSNYILDEDVVEIEKRFVDSEIITIADAGHWVHAEQPEVFLNTVLGFCLR